MSPETPAGAGGLPKPSPQGQQTARPPSQKVLLFVKYKINIPSPPGLLAVQMFMPLEREKRCLQVLPEQMGAKAVIKSSAIRVSDLLPKGLQQVGKGWLMWASAITLCLMGLSGLEMLSGKDWLHL